MTEPGERPPVEPMSDVAWARVERGLWARMDGAAAPRRRRVRPWQLGVAGALAAAAALIVWLVARTPDRPQVATAPPPPVEEPTRAVSGETPSAVQFGDIHITLDADSAVVMQHEADRPIALLERGAAWFSVAPRGARPAFEVRAGDLAVRVIGTRFRVARDAEHAEVAVDHGVVEVTFRGSVVRVGAGESWTSEAPGTVAEVAAAEPEPVLAPPARPRPRAAAPSPPPDRDRARYDELVGLEVKDPQAAIQGYLELAKSSRWADVALFAAARLAADRHDPRAQTLLSIYLRRFPHGDNAEDARQLLARVKGEP
ncbi:MAG TPA: FecR family protein [Kofleriaceae bacterium]|nr:FecR family protein [Kofleriaceae bacterium]